MTVNVFQILLGVLIGLMTISGGFLLPEEVKKAESLFQKIAFCLLIAFCAGITAIAGGIITSPVNDTTYWVLGVGYPVALPTTWILLQRQQQAERENSQSKLRQILLTAVTEEVNQRWKFSLHEQKLIQVSSKPHDHLAPLPAPAPPVEPPPSPFKIFKPVAKILKPVADVLRFVHIFKPDAQEPEIIPLELNKPIIEIFNQDNIGGKLLIFGEPGSGKTTELLNLAIALCKNAANSEQVGIPVIFELSAWKGQPIAEWLAEELKIRDGIDESLTLEWLRQDKIIPLLDGLDELKELKDDGIEAINQFYQEFRPQHLVICSRLKDYHECQKKLAPKGAICLQPLNDQQIQDYLEKRHCLQLWQPIKNDPDGLLELARSPLLLNLIPAAYQYGFVGKGKRCQTEEEREAYQKECRGDLFDAYVEHQLASKVDNRGYSKEQTKHWLTWLAQRLREERRTDFYIEKMQPTWLETPAQRQKYQLRLWLSLSLSFGLIYGMVFSSIFSPIYALIIGLIYGLIPALILQRIVGMSEIKLTEAISFNLAKLKNAIKNGLINGLILALFFGLINGLAFVIILGIRYELVAVLVFGLISALTIMLSGWLIDELKIDIKIRKFPNQGIRQSANIAIINTIFICPAGVLCFVLPNLVLGNPVAIIDALTQGTAIALFLGIVAGGGLACIQHFVLRVILYQSGAIPRDYVDFLDYADKLDLIDRVGGRYRFYHDLLREHFAGE